MISNQKNYYSLRVLALAFSVLLLMLGTFFYVGTVIIPNKLKSEVSQSCIQHLQDKSYQIKQALLENVNNSRLWIESRENTFFDSKWFAISYYEHDGKEWVLKDFKLNDTVLEIYKIAQSEYIKVDQSLIAPSPISQQITLQESHINDMDVLVLDIPNNIPHFTSNHLIRITLFPDQFVSTLNSDDKCPLNMMDAKGNFLISDLTNDVKLEDKNVFSFKVLKNLYMLGEAKPQANIFFYSFLQIGIFNFLAITIILLVAFQVLYSHFIKRLAQVNDNIHKLSEKDYHLKFNLSLDDELSSTEEEVSRLADELRKNKK